MKRIQVFSKFNMRLVYSLLIVTFFSIVQSCKKEKTPIDEPESIIYTAKIDLTPRFGSEKIVLDDSIYVLTDGTKIQFNEIKCYFSDISIGSQNLNSIALYDYRTFGTKLIAVSANPSDGNLLSGIGVPSSLNHNDPSAFASSNPLNIAIANDMHWDWSPGYIFLKIEAKVDTIPDATTNLNHYLVYHIGKDENFQTLNLPAITWTNVSATLKQLSLKLDMKELFENATSPVDFATEYTTHSNASQQLITDKIRQNFVSSISVE